jgi:hypothetical protein
MKATLAAPRTFVLGTTGRLPSSWDHRPVSYSDILARLAEIGRRTNLIAFDSHMVVVGCKGRRLIHASVPCGSVRSGGRRLRTATLGSKTRIGRTNRRRWQGRSK